MRTLMANVLRDIITGETLRAKDLVFVENTMRAPVACSVAATVLNEELRRINSSAANDLRNAREQEVICLSHLLLPVKELASLLGAYVGHDILYNRKDIVQMYGALYAMRIKRVMRLPTAVSAYALKNVSPYAYDTISFTSALVHPERANSSYRRRWSA